MLGTVLCGICFVSGVKTISEFTFKEVVKATHKVKTKKEEKKKKKKDKKEVKEVAKGENEMRAIVDEKVNAFENWMRVFCEVNTFTFSKASQTRFFVNGTKVDIKYKVLDKDSLKLVIVTDDALCDYIEKFMEQDPAMELLGEFPA